MMKKLRYFEKIYIYIISSTHGLMVQTVREFERNSVVVGSIPTQGNFL